MTVKKKTTVKKKAVSKKKAAVKKKSAARKKTAVKKTVINHDPFAVLQEEADSPLQADSGNTEQVTVETAEPPVALEVEDIEPEVQGMTEPLTSPESGTNGDNAAMVELGHNLTIADAEARKIDFMNIITDGVPVKLSAADVEQIDGAGVQLLAALFKDAALKHVSIEWGDVSPALQDAVKMLGLTEALKMQDVAHEDDGEGTAWGLF